MFIKRFDKLLGSLGILIADENLHLRKLTRTMLMNLGARSLFEAADGVEVLEVIQTNNPDIVILDWDMPLISGPDIVRHIRSPGCFPKPDLPIIVLAASARREELDVALRVGVHEFLVKPTSPKALRDRLLSIILKPRRMIMMGRYYVPERRIAVTP
jgi:two-component system, chemotaxis family, chemotaxis protein CheY